LELHRGTLLATQYYNVGALDTNCTGSSLDGFESIFDLKDVAVGTEDRKSSVVT